MKCGIIGYDGEGPHMQTLVAVGSLGASPHMGDMFGVLPITFFTYPFYLDKPTSETAEPIFTCDMSKSVVPRELHSFVG